MTLLNLKAATAASFVAFASLASAAAPPSYQDADQWRRELRAAVDETGKALRQSELQTRQGQRWAAIVTRAQVLFGKDLSVHDRFGSCTAAATLLATAWQDQLANRRKPGTVDASGQTLQAFEAGSHYTACRRDIDDLESKR
jgi:hypothetical protein